ncbi:MAG: A/G-specific adenine glycosylase [Clostridiales Family XIII bacterium]|jgi:A/G-specific adenine glycosylase|nr:A/G-specific adenine glycosylase [Clostridiales Family XIII bacterium]
MNRDEKSPPLPPNAGLFDHLLAKRLLSWYAAHARDLPWRRDRDPYHVWISEIMLQQTRVDTVIPYYERFLIALPTMQALAAADEDELLKLWEGLGYYSRARNLQKAAKMIMDVFDGDFPPAYDEMRRLPGIGSYTSGAIASICFDLPTPAVDGNVLRVLSRLLATAGNVDAPETKKQINDMLADVYISLPSQSNLRGAFTQALMELGAMICIPNGEPSCGVCPVKDFCAAFQSDAVMQYPVRAEKKAKREEDITVLILCCDGKYAVRRRPKKGLLAGMWELPNVNEHLTEEGALEWAQERGIPTVSARMGLGHTHVFTHIRWHMRSVVIECEKTEYWEMTDNATANDLVWATPEALSEIYALPTAFRKFVRRS